MCKYFARGCINNFHEFLPNESYGSAGQFRHETLIKLYNKITISILLIYLRI